MTESEYLRSVCDVLEDVQDAFDQAQIGADCALVGQVLTVEFDDGTKAVINAHTPMRQLWLASPGGGMHFSFDGERWVDQRSGVEFYQALARIVAEHSDRPIAFPEH
jgi:CyaY protein